MKKVTTAVCGAQSEASHETLCDYFDRIEVIHLPSRTDRAPGMRRELHRIGAGLTRARVHVGCAPIPDDAAGFSSRGVRGCYLSHLQALQSALQEGAHSLLVLEDDAIFSRHLVRSQAALCGWLSSTDWDLFYLGHSLSGRSGGLVRLDPALDFTQAHCYAVHARVLPELVDYLQRILLRPAGDPNGGPMHVDGVFTWFRRTHPEVKVWGAFPALSVQRRCPSSLADSRWYDRVGLLRPLIQAIRSMLDWKWRLSSGILRDYTGEGALKVRLP